MRLALLLIVPTMLSVLGEPVAAQTPGPMAGPLPADSYAGMAGGYGADVINFDGGGPTYRGAAPRGYFNMDAAYWTPRSGSSRAVLARSASVPTDVLLTKDNFDYQFEVLPRLTAGYVLPNGLAVEATYFYKDDITSNQGLNDPGDIDTFPFGDLGPTSSSQNADRLVATTTMQLQSAEVSLVETDRFFNFIAALRWIELQDRTLSETFGANGNGVLNIGTYNRLFGSQTGVRMQHSWGLIGLQAQGKAGLFFNDAHSRTTAADPGTGLSLNQFRADSRNEAFVGEMQFMATIRTNSAWQFRIGYDAMWITQVALSLDQIRGDLNTGRMLNARSDVFIHGPFVGGELRW